MFPLLTALVLSYIFKSLTLKTRVICYRVFFFLVYACLRMPGTPNKYGSREDAALGSFYKGTWYPSPEARKNHSRHRSDGEVKISKAADEHKELVLAEQKDKMAMLQTVAMPTTVV